MMSRIYSRRADYTPEAVDAEFVRRGEMSSPMKLVIAVVGAIIILSVFLGIQKGLFDALMATLDKRFGTILTGLGK